MAVRKSLFQNLIDPDLVLLCMCATALMITLSASLLNGIEEIYFCIVIHDKMEGAISVFRC